MKKQTITMTVSTPTVPEAKKLTKEDVWGKWDDNTHKRLSEGMIVAQTDQICPIWRDKVPYKSVTVICSPEQETEVRYWLEYVHGGNSVSRWKEIKQGKEKKIALRSNYMC